MKNILVGLLTLVVVSCTAKREIRFIQPEGLAVARGYSHVVTVTGGKTIYIAGQVSIDTSGAIVGAGDVKAQMDKVYQNLGVALKSVGADYNDLVKLTTYVVNFQPEHLQMLREVRANYLNPKVPPANTLVGVTALARPEYLVEIEAVAVVK